MLKLMKYEFRKTLFTKLVLLGLTAVAEAFFLYTLLDNQVEKESVAILLLALLALFGILFMGIQSILTLHRDMNTRQGYMLFMTPNSCYRILGAKVLENGFSMLLAGAFYFGLGALDIMLLLARNHSLELALETLRELFSMLGTEISFNLPDILCFVAALLCDWLSTVTLAYFADIISSSLLNGKRGGLLISFLLFLLLNYAVAKLLGVLPAMPSVGTDFLLKGGCCLAIAGITYVISARLMQRYLSV